MAAARLLVAALLEAVQWEQRNGPNNIINAQGTLRVLENVLVKANEILGRAR